MFIPNPLILFNNHFAGHRRHYPYRTRLAIARDLGYDGYEFHPIEPEDEAAWSEAGEAFRASGLRHTGMYVVARGAADSEAGQLEEEIRRIERIIDRLARLAGGISAPFLNLTISSNPSPGSSKYTESGSARAEARHWERAARIVKAADAALAARSLQGNLYNHVWFILDTPQAILRVLEQADARVLRPGIASFHAHFHEGVPDAPDLFRLAGMDRLGYVALLNALPAPPPFRTVPIDEGQIDLAGLLAVLWHRNYRGPIVLQAYDLGGDPYVTAQRSIQYVREVWARFQRNPELDPLWDASSR
ncbi:MAG: TIM barrel protein [Planctomycetes bacterium]|nr:TIM barrel protein [Planctomycetota bacterium]